MFTYESNCDLKTIAQRISESKRIVVTTHAKPDGDAMGSVLAFKRALEPRIEVDILLMGPVTASMRAVAGETPWLNAEQQMPPSGEDLVLMVDTGAFSQVSLIDEWLRERHDHVIVIDHHASGDDTGAFRYVDPTAASATMLVLQVLDAMDIEIQGGQASVAEALFCGLATDTGWFRHSNADARAFSVASRLLELDIDRDGLFRSIEETARPSRIALQAIAMNSLEYVLGGRGSIMQLGPEDFQRTSANSGELAGTVNIPMVIMEVEFSILLYSETGLETKASFRSKPPRHQGGPFVNVSELAGRLGGGGHVHASGARIAGGLEEARQKIQAVIDELEIGE
ncbi:MAG: hypothetical protein CMJ40_10830 [Phycisphaerae bacterium]|nr:hypothetical protein [Phycisphaerae bacterium]|tara:strand:- start:998 stop:2020 length:1023 start_codon:yes stop_codon:yes gene_type:complete